MKKFFRVTSPDIQCNMYYFVIIMSSVLIYFILFVQGYYASNSVEDRIYTLFIMPTILLGMTPFLIRRYTALNKLLNNNNTIVIEREQCACTIGVFLIHCQVVVNDERSEIVLIKNKKNINILSAGRMHLIIDKSTNELILKEVYTQGLAELVVDTHKPLLDAMVSRGPPILNIGGLLGFMATNNPITWFQNVINEISGSFGLSGNFGQCDE